MAFKVDRYSPLFQRVSCELWHIRLPIAEPHYGTYVAPSLKGFISLTGAMTLLTVLKWVAVSGNDTNCVIEWQRRGAPHVVLRMYERDRLTKARL